VADSVPAFAKAAPTDFASTSSRRVTTESVLVTVPLKISVVSFVTPPVEIAVAASDRYWARELGLFGGAVEARARRGTKENRTLLMSPTVTPMDVRRRRGDDGRRNTLDMKNSPLV
jgi:hypothetical protein